LEGEEARGPGNSADGDVAVDHLEKLVLIDRDATVGAAKTHTPPRDREVWCIVRG